MVPSKNFQRKMGFARVLKSSIHTSVTSNAIIHGRCIARFAAHLPERCRMGKKHKNPWLIWAVRSVLSGVRPWAPGAALVPNGAPASAAFFGTHLFCCLSLSLSLSLSHDTHAHTHTHTHTNTHTHGRLSLNDVC